SSCSTLVNSTLSVHGHELRDFVGPQQIRLPCGVWNDTSGAVDCRYTKSATSNPTMLITLEDLLPTLLSRLARVPRLVVAISGPPGSGKPTASATLCAAINREQPQLAVVVPMDGFHLDNALLDERGLRKRKGSPPTFDTAGFEVLLRR